MLRSKLEALLCEGDMEDEDEDELGASVALSRLSMLRCGLWKLFLT